MKPSTYDYQILELTNAFYEAYPKENYPEILEKQVRAYNCIVFEVSSEYFVCIPYRTEIKHKYAYHFKRSLRSRKHKSGLDYTKMVVITNGDYIDTQEAIIDKDEYIETVQNIDRIQAEVLAFLGSYINHMQGETLLHISEYRRRYQYSPLQYFHRELGL